jgi:hypothetical protein
MHVKAQMNRQSTRSSFSSRLNAMIFQWVTVSFLSLGLTQVSHAGVMTSQEAIQEQASQQRMDDVQAYFLREDVAAELLALGVEPAVVLSRMQNLTDAEIAALHGKIESQVAGGDALAVIGAVFLVLLILEVVGVTDIFKSI